MRRMPVSRFIQAVAMALVSAAVSWGQQATPTTPGKDANGNPLRVATKTGHVSNYDEAKVTPYRLPDPLVLGAGTPVTDAKTWTSSRRPEIIRIYETEIFGKIPANTPRVTWTMRPPPSIVADSTREITVAAGTIGGAADAPVMNLTLYPPAGVRTRVPVILLLPFGGGRRATIAQPRVSCADPA